MRCPACQTQSSGAYCPECGTPLRVSCKSCQAPVPAGARFCTECGARVRAARANLPWYLAGAALVGLILVVLVPLSGSAPAPATSAAAQSAPMLDGGAGAGTSAAGDETPPPLTGTPREQADRLFNLIMQNIQRW